MTKYGKYESDGLWSAKWMRWTMIYDIWYMKCMGLTLVCEHNNNGVVVR